jgi:hypothetical protein
MTEDIDIGHTFVKIPVRITVGGKKYPITQFNIDIVREYWDTKDPKVLDKLNDFVLVTT